MSVTLRHQSNKIFQCDVNPSTSSAAFRSLIVTGRDLEHGNNSCLPEHLNMIRFQLPETSARSRPETNLFTSLMMTQRAIHTDYDRVALAAPGVRVPSSMRYGVPRSGPLHKYPSSLLLLEPRSLHTISLNTAVFGNNNHKGLRIVLSTARALWTGPIFLQAYKVGRELWTCR